MTPSIAKVGRELNDEHPHFTKGKRCEWTFIIPVSFYSVTKNLLFSEWPPSLEGRSGEGVGRIAPAGSKCDSQPRDIDRGRSI
jgi:hypothetical protein